MTEHMFILTHDEWRVCDCVLAAVSDLDHVHRLDDGSGEHAGQTAEHERLSVVPWCLLLRFDGNSQRLRSCSRHGGVWSERVVREAEG